MSQFGSIAKSPAIDDQMNVFLRVRQPRPVATFAALCLALLACAAARAEEPTGAVVVRVRSGSAPVPAAEVSVAGAAGGVGGVGVTAETDARGEARLELAAGEQELLVRRAGFAPATVRVAVAAGGTVEAAVQLRAERFEDTVTVVAATRSGRMVEDQALRVEALPQEEIEENSTLAPGNLSTLLNEIGGLRVQAVSPALGGANLRLQGLPGRYTTVLWDELPLYGGQSDAFALLQVPPLDLAQAEVIKGTASALYGGAALGGVVNLVSRRPDGEPEVLLSQSLHGGTDAVGFVPGKLGGRWGYTLLGSANRQLERDLDGDGWAELPGYRRGVFRPRLFWDDGAGHSLFATVGGVAEHREGGTVAGAVTPDGTAFVEELDSRRLDGGVVGRFLIGQDRLLSLHASWAQARRDHRFGEVRERDRRSFGFAELSLGGSDRGHTWVLGAALDRQSYRFEDVAGFDSTSTAPALFVQDEVSPGRRLSLSASVRADFDRRYGTFVNPRLSALVRAGGGWSLRASVGTGYAAPTPFLDETEAIGLSRVLAAPRPHRRTRSERLARRRLVARPLRDRRDPVRLADPRRAAAPPVGGRGRPLRDRQRPEPHRRLRLAVPGPLPSGPAAGDRHPHLPALDRVGPRRSRPARDAADPEARGRAGGPPRGGVPRPDRNRGVLHRPPVARSRPLPQRERTVRRGQRPGRAAARRGRPLRQRDQPHRGETDALRPPAPAGARRRRALDDRPLGAAGGSFRQRRRALRVLNGGAAPQPPRTTATPRAGSA